VCILRDTTLVTVNALASREASIAAKLTLEMTAQIIDFRRTLFLHGVKNRLARQTTCQRPVSGLARQFPAKSRIETSPRNDKRAANNQERHGYRRAPPIDDTQIVILTVGMTGG
jgi:hypothetical protein